MTYGVTAGIAFSGNLVTMYLFYELLTLVTFPLVLHPMTKEAMRASRKYLYYSIGGAAFAFIGLIFVIQYSATGTTEFVPGGVLSLTAAEGDRGTLLRLYSCILRVRSKSSGISMPRLASEGHCGSHAGDGPPACGSCSQNQCASPFCGLPISAMVRSSCGEARHSGW